MQLPATCRRSPSPAGPLPSERLAPRSTRFDPDRTPAPSRPPRTTVSSEAAHPRGRPTRVSARAAMRLARTAPSTRGATTTAIADATSLHVAPLISRSATAPPASAIERYATNSRSRGSIVTRTERTFTVERGNRCSTSRTNEGRSRQAGGAEYSSGKAGARGGAQRNQPRAESPESAIAPVRTRAVLLRRAVARL